MPVIALCAIAIELAIRSAATTAPLPGEEAAARPMSELSHPTLTIRSVSLIAGDTALVRADAVQFGSLIAARTPVEIIVKYERGKWNVESTIPGREYRRPGDSGTSQPNPARTQPQTHPVF